LSRKIIGLFEILAGEFAIKAKRDGRFGKNSPEWAGRDDPPPGRRVK
jgi:hypothetical protein